MDHEDVEERLTHQPHTPKRKFTALDVALIGGTPILLYGGRILAGTGNAIGIVLAGVAMLATAAIRAVGLGHTDEPVIASQTYPASIGVGVIALVITVNMWRAAPIEAPALLLTSLISVILFAGYLLLLLQPKIFP